MFELTEVGFSFVVLGIILAVVAIAMLAVSKGKSAGRTRAAGILLIGPIPIMFGTDRESVRVLAVLAVVLMIVVLALMFLPSVQLWR
jgi:uncharacterized protein (TIGR00304 family)